MLVPDPLHPALVHFPIVLILVAALFELVGRATDLTWWRKAAMAMLVIGTLGAWGAVWSGKRAEEPAEHQGVPEEAIEEHEAAAWWTAWLATGAVVARAAAGRAGSAAGAVGTVGLVLHLLAAGAVSVTGYRGGRLVYDHGAGVKVDGKPVKSAEAHEEHHSGP